MQPEAMSSLMELFPEVPGLVWAHLKENPGNEPQLLSQPHQHAFRSTCKAVRQATSPLINRLTVTMRPPVQGGFIGEGMLQGLGTLSRFPTPATLRYLRLNVAYNTEQGMLPGFMVQGGVKLAALEDLKLYNTPARGGVLHPYVGAYLLTCICSCGYPISLAMLRNTCRFSAPMTR